VDACSSKLGTEFLFKNNDAVPRPDLLLANPFWLPQGLAHQPHGNEHLLQLLASAGPNQKTRQIGTKDRHRL